MVKTGDYDTSQSTLAGKRKKVEEESMSAMVSKKQRTRVSFSCGECHRRKQKCDRQVPCSHCVARKVPELCKAYTPGKADQDLNARITRLEQIVEMALPQFCVPDASSSYSVDRNPSAGPTRHRTSSSGEDDSNSQNEEQDPSSGTFQSGNWYGASVSGSVVPASLIEQIEHAAIPSSRGEMGHSRTGSLASNFSPSLASYPQQSMDAIGVDVEPSAADNLKSLVQECGVSPHKISELLREIPPLRVSDALIDFYFSAINWTRYPISVQDFRASYSSICACNSGVSAAGPQDVRFLPLLFVVLAISVRLAPESIAGDARVKRVTSLRYYWSSRRSLLIAAAIQPDSLEIVLTCLLSARFLTFDRRITECWSQLGAAVRTAQALGLHRDGSPMRMPPEVVEYRRRIWSYLYHADRSYALVLGRPKSIQDEYTSTLPPSNAEADLQGGTAIQAYPLSHPTPMTFVILRHQLAEIIGRIVHHFQKAQEKTHYSEVVALDDELLKFINTLPPHYSLQADTSLDHGKSYLAAHRFLLITEILFVRISLHRPYMLRRLHSDRYSRSRNACFESAITDFQVRQAFRQTAPKDVRGSLSNAYREFQTAMISGIYFVLEPKGQHADAMHAILEGFVKEHEGMAEMDETTKRELKTIEFLQSKASQLEVHGLSAQRTSKLHESSLSSMPEQQAHLLLSLQQPINSPTSKTYSFTNPSSPHSPPFQRPNSSSLAQSPTMQRLQHPDQLNSPTTSGSPSRGDDESPAQSLLDTWCHTVSNATNDLSTGAISWGGGELAGWAGVTHTSNLPDPRLFPGLDGSDYAYWEALMNQIHRGP